MINKLRSREEIISLFHDGQTIAIGGIAAVFMPWELIDLVYESGAKDLTLISLDAADPGFAHSKLFEAGRVKKIITTHLGMNPVASKLVLEGKLEMELCPIGSWAERMRCAGSGLGGVLTKTGLGTVIQEGKQVVTVNGEEYLLEEAFHPDISISRARRIDPFGNMCLHGTGRASHPIVAMASPVSVVQADLYCDFYEFGIDDIDVPQMYVDHIYLPHVQGSGKFNEMPLVGPAKQFVYYQKQAAQAAKAKEEK